MKRPRENETDWFGPTVRATVAAGALPLWRHPHDCRAVVVGWRPRRPVAQPPKPYIPDITERSGLLMRFASTPEMLPPDPHRDFFYNTRYADNGRVKHPNWVCTQGLYGLGWKTPDTQSVYPVLLRRARPEHHRFVEPALVPSAPVLPGAGPSVPPRRDRTTSSARYVPIYDLDPIAPGPGPYPYPFYFNWLHGG